ncbi:ArsR/SmtB family transcription factor [Micromonosporaceae bacterium DT55]|uniref:ArsR/SmtB family transcription factor n=2 Tax=Melissospora conviva TaxID=3388432 RepID=UPI003C266DEF
MTQARARRRGMTITDPRVMRALAHPARVAILQHLGSLGAGASATECAEVAGLSPSATSYHLRALARFGLVEEAPGRGDARERLWRTVNPALSVQAGPEAGPEARAAEEILVEAHLTRGLEQVRAWMARSGQEPAEWHEAALLSDSVLLLTAEELAALNGAVNELLEPYRRRNRGGVAPAGSRAVAVQYRAIPGD